MASIWTPVDPRLASPALWTILVGLILFGSAMFMPQSAVVLVPCAVFFLVIGIGAYRGKMWAAWLGAIALVALPLIRIGMMLAGLIEFDWLKIVFTLVIFWLAWDYIRVLIDNRRRVRAIDWDPDESDLDASVADQEDDDEDKPLISFALLLAKPRYLEENVLAQIIEECWGGDYTSGNEDEQDGFVVGGGEVPIYMVKAPNGMFMIHNQPSPYWDDTEEVAEEIGELRLRKAVLDHEAWMAVDLLSAFDDDADPDSFYPQIIRLIVELADEDTLAILRPETGQINLWSDDVFETLVRPQGHDEFSTPTEVPVIPVEDDDPLMTAAVEEARSRWPEFAEKFESRGKDDSFSVKAAVTAGGNTEFIWMNVIGLEPEYIHGELANEPIDLGDLKLGSRVEVSLADLNDWAYQVGEEEPQGLFTVKAITEAQKRFRES